MLRFPILPISNSSFGESSMTEQRCVKLMAKFIQEETHLEQVMKERQMYKSINNTQAF